MCQLFKILLAIALFAMCFSAKRARKKFDWWENAIIYEIYPRSFYDSNSDGIGDLKGISLKLDYFVDLGVTALWLAPFFESPMVDFGYDISNYTVIDPVFGNMADFEELIEKADSLDIKIILDFVPNHTSDQSEWFQKSVNRVKGYEDFYIWVDGKRNRYGEMEPPNNWRSVFIGSAWTWNEKRQQFYLHQFAWNQPDLNFRNPRVWKAIDNVLLFWLDKGINGFRVDAVNHIYESTHLRDEPLFGDVNDTTILHSEQKHVYTKNLPELYKLLRHWRELVDDYTRVHGGCTRIITTEAYAPIKIKMLHYRDLEGRELAHFPFNFLLVMDLNRENDARDFVYTIQQWMTYMPRGHVANWVTGNHDQRRVATRFHHDFIDAMNMLVMTLPGVVVTYYGDEIGMEDHQNIGYLETFDPLGINAGPESFKGRSRDPERTPFQWNGKSNAGFTKAKTSWLPVNPNYKKLNLNKQKSAKKSHYKVYKRLASLKKDPILREGALQLEVLNNDVFAIKRELASEKSVYITVINVSNETHLVDLSPLGKLPSLFTVIVASTTSEYNFGNTIDINNLTLQNFESLLLQGSATIFAERRALIGTLIKSANIILVGLLMYKLWHNKWTKLNYNKEALF